ncbi:unnamed protein product, partial [Anisakis simplex]|uniref:Uncharacterized protein n=1 Tax=Anisakis simplex TaxID=6269 RepID=A0A0M3J2E7_ANISI
MGKRRGNRTEPLIPKSLKANITSKMREEKDAEEIFENAFVPVIRYDRKQEPLRGQLEKVFDEVQKPELRIVNDIQMTKMISGKFLNIQSKQIVPDENIYANYEIEQSKKLLKDMISEYFNNKEDTVELTLKISRQNQYPIIHIQLEPSLLSTSMHSTVLDSDNLLVPSSDSSTHNQ